DRGRAAVRRGLPVDADARRLRVHSPDRRAAGQAGRAVRPHPGGEGMKRIAERVAERAAARAKRGGVGASAAVASAWPVACGLVLAWLLQQWVAPAVGPFYAKLILDIGIA